MYRKIFSAILSLSIFISSFSFLASRQFAAENNEVANLAMMLPESDVILAMDMDKTLNVVGPNLLSGDEMKIANLRKLMKSLENTIGIDPYEIKQIVAGIKLPLVDDKDYFNNLDYTVIFRTARSNDVLLENWSKKIDAIEAFDKEKEPTELYIEEFKTFRYYKLSKTETEDITKQTKEFEQLLKQLSAVNILFASVPKSLRSTKSYRDAVKKTKTIGDAINRYQDWLKKDSNATEMHNAAIKLQNRWTEVSLDDPKRGEKLSEILKDARAMYPAYKTRVELIARVEALINYSNYQFYGELAKKSFGTPQFDFSKDPNDFMKETLEEILTSLAEISLAKSAANEMKLIAASLQKLDNAMLIRLKNLETVEKFEELKPVQKTAEAKVKTFSQSLRENAKISEVNGKRLITMDLEKVNFWNPGIEEAEPVKLPEQTGKETAGEVIKVVKENEEKAPAVKAETPKTKTESPVMILVKEDTPPKEKKKELFAIGYLDNTTMVFGFEPGIRSILNRKSEYKNPKAAEMVNTFKNPLISFATNSKVFQNFTKGFEPPKTDKEKDKEKEKKLSPTDKFFSDVNIFGSVEYDGDSVENDVMMSLGFTKNSVSDVFDVKNDLEEGSVLEVGDYQLGKALMYDLLNTMKSFKASMSFKFEKKKLAALIESTPQILEEIRDRKIAEKSSESNTKTKINDLNNIDDVLTSPKFYVGLVEMLQRNPRR